jgi:hypothetical protein
MNVTWLFASDIDNTLTGDRKALNSLRAELDEMRANKELFLILSTGRRLPQIIDGIQEEGIPEPDAVVSQVGTEIYMPPLQEDTEPLGVWKDYLMQDFSREEAESFLEGVEGVVMQPDIYNTPLKVSCYLDSAPDPDTAAEVIRERAEASSGLYQVVYSSGRDLDIIPAAAGKGKAIRFLISFLNIEAEKTVVAGDSGNDKSMFDEFEHGIIVANAKPELKALRNEHPGTGLYFAKAEYAAGVREGLKSFGMLS